MLLGDFSSNNSHLSFCLNCHHHVKSLLAHIRARPKAVGESLQPLCHAWSQQQPLPFVTAAKEGKKYLLGGKIFCCGVLLLLFVLFYIHTYFPVKNCHSFSHIFTWKPGNFEVIVIWTEWVAFPLWKDSCLLWHTSFKPRHGCISISCVP